MSLPAAGRHRRVCDCGQRRGHCAPGARVWRGRLPRLHRKRRDCQGRGRAVPAGRGGALHRRGGGLRGHVCQGACARGAGAEEGAGAAPPACRGRPNCRSYSSPSSTYQPTNQHTQTQLFLHCIAQDADKEIIRRIKEAGRLVDVGAIVHSYPFCWRSDTPLIYKAVPSWFVRVEEIKPQLLANNEKTYWVRPPRPPRPPRLPAPPAPLRTRARPRSPPAGPLADCACRPALPPCRPRCFPPPQVPSYVKEKRFHNWLENARDWVRCACCACCAASRRRLRRRCAARRAPLAPAWPPPPVRHPPPAGRVAVAVLGHTHAPLGQ